jgi:hypothetical protein
VSTLSSGAAGATPLRFLWRWALARPGWTLAATLLAVALAGTGLRHLRLVASIDLLAPGDPVAQQDRQRRLSFGDDFPVLLGLLRTQEQGGLLDPAPLVALRDLHRAVAAEPGVARVASLASAPALVPAADLPSGAPLLDEKALAEPYQLFTRLRASPVQQALLLAPRRSLTPLLLTPSGALTEDRLTARLLEVAAAMEQQHPQAGRVLVVGPAVVESGLSGQLFADLARLVPFCVALVALGLLLALRRAVFLAVTLVHAVALEAVVLGSMAALGGTINLVSVLAPVVLVPVGVADLLHLAVRLKREATPAGPRRQLAAAFAALERPMVLTSATTALGFLGFLVSPVPAIRGFGLTLAGGAVAALLLTFTLDAALLALLWRPDAVRARRKPGRRRRGPLERWLLALESPQRRRRRSRLTLAVCLLLALAAVTTLPGLHIEDTWIRNFDPGSRVVRDTLDFESELLGTNVLAIVFEPQGPPPYDQEDRQRLLEAVNRFTISQTVVPGVRGLLSATMLARSLDPQQDFVWKPWPTPTPEAMAQAMATWRRRGMALPEMEQLVTADLSRYQVLLFVLNQPYPGLIEVLDRLTAEARQRAGEGVAVHASGNLAVNIRMVHQAVVGQALSLGALLLTITLLLAALTRSLTSGALLVLPMALAILSTYGLLQLLGLPYGVAVSMFPTLVVGLSVDFSIHLRSALLRTRWLSRRRRLEELAVTARGVLLNGLLWTGGFALLTASALPPNRYLGLLTSVVVALSTLASLALLPTLAQRFGRRP